MQVVVLLSVSVVLHTTGSFNMMCFCYGVGAFPSSKKNDVFLFGLDFFFVPCSRPQLVWVCMYQKMLALFGNS
jgi:hypothetical protein